MKSENFNAAVEGKNIRVTKQNGTPVMKFNAGDGITHAICNESTVSVFYTKGGVKVYSIPGGSLQSMTGDCR
jgi:uncharacterized cupin superfamily protein